MSKPIIRLRGAGKSYTTGGIKMTVLQPVTLDLFPKELVLLMGPSGSGKTTLLSLIGCVIYASMGDIFIEDIALKELSEKTLADIRLKKIGFVFQNYNLISPLTSIENVMFPLQLQNVNTKNAKCRALEIIKEVDMEHRANSLPKQLSGGEQQRIAIARALVAEPPILLCDEPTGALDKASGEKVMAILHKQAEIGKCVIVVTHDQRLINYADRVLYIENGILSDKPYE